MRILLAEDDPDNAKFVERGLAELGHNVTVVRNGEDALHLGLTEAFDIVVLDRMMPGRDGLSVLRAMRAADVETPAIMLTALGQIEDRVQGLNAGADDYLVKPFAFSELAARLNAMGRRKAPRQVQTLLTACQLEMNLLTREVRRSGMAILLQPKEFRLLEELMRYPGEYITRTMLLERVWDFHFDPQTKIVETHMSRLRAKLNFGGLDDVIDTLRGTGYRVRAG